MSKLLVLKSTIDNSVIAITEHKYHMRLFILQHEYTKEQYSLHIYKNENKINDYLIKYSEYYLIEYNDFIIRTSDKQYIEEAIYNSKKEIRNIINRLESINMYTIMDPEEHRKIGNTINLLYDKTKKKNINEFINIKYLIKVLCTNSQLRYDLQEMNDRYYYNLLEEDK